MKTDAPLQEPGSPGHDPGTPADAVAPSASASAFYALLDRQVQAQASPAPQAPIKAEGIAIGTLVEVGAEGQPLLVDIPSLGLGPMPAVSLVALSPANQGQSVAVGFEGAQAHRPIILGLMMASAAPAPAPSPAPSEALEQAVRVSQNGQRVVIEAQGELELRCGESVILLSQDGSIQIRGAYLTSHATASQRIRGGSVQIN